MDSFRTPTVSLNGVLSSLLLMLSAFACSAFMPVIDSCLMIFDMFRKSRSEEETVTECTSVSQAFGQSHPMISELKEIDFINHRHVSIFER